MNEVITLHLRKSAKYAMITFISTQRLGEKGKMKMK